MLNRFSSRCRAGEPERPAAAVLLDRPARPGTHSQHDHPPVKNPGEASEASEAVREGPDRRDESNWCPFDVQMTGWCWRDWWLAPVATVAVIDDSTIAFTYCAS